MQPCLHCELVARTRCFLFSWGSGEVQLWVMWDFGATISPVQQPVPPVGEETVEGGGSVREGRQKMGLGERARQAGGKKGKQRQDKKVRARRRETCG